MTGKSTNSNGSEKAEELDSTIESDAVEVSDAEIADEDNSDTPVVIEAEAEELPIDETSVEEKASDVAEPEPVAAPVAVEQKRGSVVPLIGGGLIAGAIGFFAANPDFDFFGSGGDAGNSVNTRIDELAAEVQAFEPTDTSPITARLDALSAEVEAIQTAPAPSGDLSASVVERIDALEKDVASELSDLGEQLARLEDRVADLEASQQGAGDGQVDAMSDEQLSSFQKELDQLTADATAQVEAAKSRAAEVEAKAAEAEASAAKQSALASLTTALESGGGYGDALKEFGDVPQALMANAENGVATIGLLQRDFPDAARAALSTTSDVPQDASAGERLTAFLKRQTNARSLAPREGNDTDAVLSRAEASLSEGDLAASVTELSALSDDAKDAMADWLTQAQSRLDALDALSELTAAAE